MASISHEGSSDILTERPYECPCKKTYKSYPALYTHIKNKHDGIPPGSIKKPTCNNKKPGRPPANFSKSTIQTQCLQSNSQVSIQFFQEQKSSVQSKPPSLENCINRIVQILDSLPEQTICRERLHEITAMMEMTVFMATKKDDQLKKSLGGVLQQFLGAITGKVQWINFKYCYTLLMLFSQYIIKRKGSSSIFYDEQPDLLCSSINDFVQTQVQQMARYYKIEGLSIFQRQCMLQLFYWFFEWMLLKQYTTYKITFKDNAGIYSF